jgi:hypothetical protein
MMPPRRPVPLLYGLTTVAVGVAVLARLLPLDLRPPAADAATVRPAPRPALPPTVAPDPTPLLDLVIAQNVFSATRSAPRVRWSPPGLEAPSMEPTPLDTLAPMLPADSGAAADPVPTLYGTVVGGAPARALLRLSTADAVPRLVAEGESHAGWRVLRVEATRVVLRPPGGGTRTLVLRTPEAR